MGDNKEDQRELPPRPGLNPSSTEVKPSDRQDKSPAAQPGPPAKPIPTARALFDYAGEEGTDLSFRVGEEILLLEKMGSDWMKGKIGNNVGMFPVDFVEIIHPL